MMDTRIIDSRDDFAQSAIDRAAEALGQAIVDALLETFDGLVGGD
ncbi:hypothetical protein [Mesorhizobium sp. BHbdii]